MGRKNTLGDTNFRPRTSPPNIRSLLGLFQLGARGLPCAYKRDSEDPPANQSV